jgi:hypothetical protein
VRLQRRLVLALVLLSAMPVAAFLGTQVWGAASAVLLLAFLTTVLFAYSSLRRPVQGLLSWDGEQWYWTTQQVQAVTELACVLDLQRVMLLRLRCGQASVQWLWLESAAMGGSWQALRRAVVAGHIVRSLMPADAPQE